MSGTEEEFEESETNSLHENPRLFSIKPQLSPPGTVGAGHTLPRIGPVLAHSTGPGSVQTHLQGNREAGEGWGQVPVRLIHLAV